ncbi:HNH endonuclease signature motif containing protein [Nocardioides coralli]|uniref:HNH endonuclease signature motif containing protein n=1 Tax=Nocardioides coralli TaxID=2872154 RepID=UPI001CA3CD21|nr:HNH endonuclease signature motif containing protein [Nocardioides coralli]QZY29990.1 HNH endonuclease [Nocardioides coralli]
MAITAPEQPDTRAVPDDAAGVLAFARQRRAAADRAEAELLAAAVQWAVIHPAESVEDAETYTFRSGLEGVIPIAGPGAPLVAEFSVAEYAAAVGLSTEAGKHYLGQAVELRYRLPRLWRRVMAGDLPAWKARRVADATIGTDLTPEAATFVDQHVAPVAHKIRPTALDRLVEEAIGRYMPDQAERRRRDGLDRRHFTIDRNHVSFDGTTYVTGELDLADAIDLDDAVRGLATQLADLGSEATLDQRRALAVGELARRQLTLDLTDPDADDGAAGAEAAGGFEARCARTSTTGDHATRTPVRKPVRKTVLYLHLSTDALTGNNGIGRCETTRKPVTTHQIRDWCGHPDTHLVVQPVIDLNQHVHVDQYEIPDRITEHVALRDVTCVFPHCTRPARRLRPDGHGCDHDHIRPYAEHPHTCSHGIAPLCRRHHRHKTHGGWTYDALEPGGYLWTSPHGYRYLRDHTGITAIDPADDNPPEPGPPTRH